MERKIWPNNHHALASCLVIAMFSILMVQPATSIEPAVLDSNALTKLALQGTWQPKRGAFGHWSWGEDKSVCHRMFGLKEDCSDTGTWEINDNVLCYELTWWGESYGIRKNCFTVVALDGGRYEALYHGSKVDHSVFINFEVLE